MHLTMQNNEIKQHVQHSRAVHIVQKKINFAKMSSTITDNTQQTTIYK